MNPARSLSQTTITAIVSTRMTKGAVALERERGKPFILVRGPNGVGKSTLLRAFMGVDDHGTAVIEESRNDSERRFYPQKDRSLIRYLPQDPSEALFPRLSVSDNVRLLSQLLHIPADFAEGVPEFAGDGGRGLYDLSGGEKKLLLLHAILLSIPEAVDRKIVFLLLDEPFAGLSPVNTKMFVDKLNAKATQCADANNITFLIVDHDHIAVNDASALRGGNGITVAHLQKLELASGHEE